jgi:hypothetical protein
VGLGFVLIQGHVNSPTPPTAVSANQTRGNVYADGTFQVTVPVVPGENNEVTDSSTAGNNSAAGR